MVCGMSEGERPLLVLVGGPSGGGKTTLARGLGDSLGIVHLCRDVVKSAIAASHVRVRSDGTPDFDPVGAVMGGEYGQRAFSTAYAAAATLLDGGASLVIDQAWRSGRSESELQPLLRMSRPLLVIASAPAAISDKRIQSRGERAGLASVSESLAATEQARESS